MDVGIRDLKSKLSEHLKRAAAGEIITVTDRGRPIATLGPVLGPVDLQAASQAGWLTLPTSSGLAAIVRHQGSSSIQQVLDSDRSE